MATRQVYGEGGCLWSALEISLGLRILIDGWRLGQTLVSTTLKHQSARTTVKLCF